MTAASQRALCIGLTPAFQRILRFDAWTKNEVNRACHVQTCAAGKGVNVVRALKHLNVPCDLLTFLGGDTGDAIRAEIEATGNHTYGPRTLAATRICQTLLDGHDHTVTELVEEAAPPTEAEWVALGAEYAKQLPAHALVLITGTLMPGATETVYADFAAKAQASHVPVMIDSHRAPLEAVLPYQPLLVKMNAHELGLTVKRAIENEKDLLEAGEELRAQGAQHVFITQGAGISWWIHAGGSQGFRPPKIKPVNPIGSGDSMTAGIAAGWMAHGNMERALLQGIACGTANALTDLPAQFDRDTVNELLPKVERV